MKYKPDVPHDDEITWDAGDARIVRSMKLASGNWEVEYEEQYPRTRKKIGLALVIIVALLCIGIGAWRAHVALDGSIVRVYETQGIPYECTHFENGEMKCNILEE